MSRMKKKPTEKLHSNARSFLCNITLLKVVYIWDNVHLTYAMRWGRGGYPKSDHSWSWLGKGVKDPANTICARPFKIRFKGRLGQFLSMSTHSFCHSLSDSNIARKNITCKWWKMESRLRLWLTQVVMVMCSSSVKVQVLWANAHSYEASTIMKNHNKT